MADSPAECQKLVLVELHVSQASAAGISRCLGRDESSECLTYDLVHSWRSRGQNAAGVCRAQIAPARCGPYEQVVQRNYKTTKITEAQEGGGGGSGRNPNRASYASTTEHSASLQAPKSASSRPYFAKCCWYAPMDRSLASLSR